MFSLNRLEFGAGWNPTPYLVKGSGDGTVNERSLIGCGYWENTPAQGNHKIYQHAYPGVEHYNMLSDTGAINYILGRLTDKADYPRRNEKTNFSNMMKIRLF